MRKIADSVSAMSRGTVTIAYLLLPSFHTPPSYLLYYKLIGAERG